ncbi:MAG: helix-turn-helix transcriptional regulator [Amphritea sp.]
MGIQNIEAHNFTNTSKGIAELLNHVQLSSFTKVLADFLARYCSYDEITVLAFTTGQKPTLVYPQGENHTALLLDYLNDGEYLMDPLLNSKLTEGMRVFRSAYLNCDSLSNSEFFQRCSQHLGYVDEVLLQIQTGVDTKIIISMGRKAQLGVVSRREMNKLKSIYPVIEALLQQFWVFQGDNYSCQVCEEGVFERALQSFGYGILTQREREISALILKGYSSKCISRTLDISIGTVKVHRRNIHSRMNISNQSDLFKEFLTYLDVLKLQAA